MKTVVVAIGGASCSGKTMLAKQLSKLLPSSILVHQDDFVPPASKIPIHPVHGVQDWDDPEGCIEWPKFRDTLRYLKREGNLPPGYASYDHLNEDDKAPPQSEVVEAVVKKYHGQFPEAKYILVDGFVLFWDKEVRETMDVELLLRVSKDTLKRRRDERTYALQRKPREGRLTTDEDDAAQGTVWTDPPGYFDDIVYPAYVKAHSGVFKDGVDSDIADESITLIEPEEGDVGVAKALEEACRAMLERTR